VRELHGCLFFGGGGGGGGLVVGLEKASFGFCVSRQVM
jgi:hypothetical protein